MRAERAYPKVDFFSASTADRIKGVYDVVRPGLELLAEEHHRIGRQTILDAGLMSEAYRHPKIAWRILRGELLAFLLEAELGQPFGVRGLGFLAHLTASFVGTDRFSDLVQ